MVDRIRALQRVEEYHDLFDAMHAAIVVHAPDTSVRYCNAVSADLLGLTMGQMAGKTAIDPAWCFVDEAEQAMGLEDYPVNRVLKSREPVKNIMVGINRPRTQDRVWVLCNAYPSWKDDGSLEQIVVTFIDISEQRRTEKEKERLEKQLHEIQRIEAVGQLAGGIAHDFNNMLTAILATCELVELGGHPSGDPLEPIREIAMAATRAAGLTRQLLAFSRKQTLHPRSLHLNSLIQDMTTMLQRLIGEAVELETSFHEPLLPVRADPGQIEQVIVNLVMNARDAMPSGGRLTLETADVDVDDVYSARHRGVAPGRYSMISVTDTGVGMDEVTRTRIFEPFFTTKDVGKGTGLGLSSVYGIVKQSGGFVWVYSEQGDGASFKIYLPIDAQVMGPSEVTTPKYEGPLRGKECILVVEDDESVRALTSLILRRYGYEVHEACGPEEALRLDMTISDNLALLLTDVVMPRANGRQLAKQLRMRRPGLKVLYMSGYTENAIAHNGVLDLDAVLVEKPFTSETLARKVRELLDSGSDPTDPG